MSDWSGSNSVHPLRGALGGAMFGVALAIVPTLILGPAAFAIGIVLGPALGAALGPVRLRPGTRVS
jgi:hypothetical protein